MNRSSNEERVLVVEDDEDSRDALALYLESEGFDVTPVGSAEDGLEKLRSSRFDLILTDYSLPEHTGAWMLQSAKEADLALGVPAILLTAHPSPERIDGAKLVRKPVDLDDLLREIHRLLHPEGRPSTRQAPPMRAQLSPRIELVLYTSRSSTASRRAVRHLERVLAQFDTSQISVSVCDLEDQPSSALEHRVDFTPTLVKIAPLPRAWLLGDLRDAAPLIDLFESAGVARRQGS